MKGLIFTYLLTYGGAAASLFSPFTGLLIYVCFAILKPESLWYWSVTPGNYSRIVALGLLVGWAVNGFGNWRFGRAWGVGAALLGYWLWAALGTALAPDQAVAWGFLETLTKIALPVLVGFTTINSVRQIKQLAWVILLSQGYVAFELNLSYFQGNNQIRDIGFAGMDNNCVAIAMVSGVGLAFFLGMGASSWWQRGVAFGAGAFLAHAVMLSFSRGGMLGLVVTGLMMFWLLPKKTEHYLAFALGFLLCLRMAGPEVVARFSTVAETGEQRDSSAQSRLDLWKACVNTMLKRPLLGVGPDHWPLVAQEYGFRKGKEAHTLWLQIGAELGIPGVLFLVSYYGLCTTRLWPLARGYGAVADPWFRDAARMVISSLTGFAVSAQFVSLEALEIPYYVAMLGAAVLKVNSMHLTAGGQYCYGPSHT